MLHPPEVDSKRRAVMARALAAAGSLSLLPVAAQPAVNGGLAPPNQVGVMSIEQALAHRRSVRRYRAQPLALATISQLLWAAQGTTGSGGQRTAPSAGAFYPLELHLLAVHVGGLAAGLHRYLPATHELHLTIAAATASALQAAAIGQHAVGSAAAVVIISAIEGRSAGKYGVRAGRYVAFEAGACAQNLALQAVALGLGTVVIGGFDDAAVARALRLSPDESPVVLMPIGVPA